MSNSPTVQTFPVVQGARSTTFSSPPLDASLTVPEILAFHAKHSSSHKLFVYTDGDEVKSIDYAMMFRAQMVAAGLVKAAFEAGSRLYLDEVARPVFGILASVDTVTYATLIFGIQQTGAVPFPISTRNSAIAVANLLRTTDVRQVFVSEDAAMRTLASEAKELLAKDGHVIELLDVPYFEELYGDTEHMPTPDGTRITPLSKDALAFILHSSGTSSFPKPIPIPHRNAISWGSIMYYGELDVCGMRMGIQPSPMFHSMGLVIVLWAVCTGIELAVYKPSHPPVVPNAMSYLDELVKSKCRWAMTVPSHVEEWSRDPVNVDLLKNHIERIIFGGGPLNKHVGDTLQAHGIFLQVGYGTTEAGIISRAGLSADSLRADQWDYFRLIPPELATVEMVPHEDHGGLLEPVVMAGERYSPNLINTTVNGKPGYATGDLVQEHTLYKGLYKIYGRVDEQIMLSTGEKTNPVPLERILLEDPQVTIAVFFGRGRFNNGVLIQPATPFDPSDADKVAEFREGIWPTVSRMNDYAPAHSRVLKQMILVANPTKPLELTAKGSVRRSVSLAKYEDEIEAIYAQAELLYDGPQPPSVWTTESTTEFVQAIVEAALDQKAAESDELFSLGCDSLAASSIRNNITRALRISTAAPELDLAREIPQNVVYQNPSIRALSDFLYALVTGRDLKPDRETILQQKVQAMETMVSKYSIGISSPRIPAGSALAQQETVLVTGTTGRLGCHLLAQLIQDPKVRRIYALNRASGGEAYKALAKRMRSAFTLWGLNPALLDSEKVTLLASNYSAERLGLGAETYAEIESQLTTIIHNAWRVDFNIVLSGYNALIAGVRRLIDLAINSSTPGGARILFVSSVSVLFNHPSDKPAPEEPITDARISAGIGYGESKWVAETLLLRARDQVGLRAATVRVGQIAGDTRIGGWSKQEWVGAIARLGQIVRALPERDEPVTWIPVDIAATAIIDMARSDEPVFNLAAPVASDWKTVFGAFARQLDLPLVKYDEWAARVIAAAEVNTNVEDTQPFALASFFQAANFGEGAKVSTERACAVSPTLANMPPMGEKDVALYVDFWRKIGFLHN